MSKPKASNLLVTTIAKALWQSECDDPPNCQHDWDSCAPEESAYFDHFARAMLGVLATDPTLRKQLSHEIAGVVYDLNPEPWGHAYTAQIVDGVQRVFARAVEGDDGA